MRLQAPRVLLLLATHAGAWTVCIDPGHGGSEPGASGIYYLEKDANLDVAFQAAGYLTQVSDCDWVGMTRTGDYTVSLANRVAYANQNGFDRFMSVHENAFNTQVQGSETFCQTLSPGTPGYDLASKVLDGIIWAHGYTNRGVKDGSWIYVIANTNMPAILGEGTFIDYDGYWNESHRYLTNWNDHTGRQGYAYAQGICMHMGSTPPSYGAQGFIVDNLSPGFSVNSQAEWNTGSYGVPWGTDYRWSSTTNQSDWARWTPTLPEAGWHDVYIWYTDGANRASNAVFTVHHQSGETQFIVDQTQAGGQWNLLGSFAFTAGTAGWVTLTEEGTTPGKVVIADAVRFEPGVTGIEHDSETPVQQASVLTVAPNPGRSFTVTVRMPEGCSWSVSVYDITGRLVETLTDGSSGGNVLQWDPSGLPAGVYTVSVLAGSDHFTQRVMLLP